MVTQSNRTLELWSLTSDTAGFNETAKIVPYDARDTGLLDLGNTMASGTLTLGADAKNNYSYCQVHATIQAGAASIPSDDYSELRLLSNAGLMYVSHRSGLGSGGANELLTPWFDHTVLLTLRVDYRIDATNASILGLDPTFGTPKCQFALEFR